MKRCEWCDGWGGVQPQSGSEHPDCPHCDNKHDLEHPYRSSPLSHRVGVFRHRASGCELVLVPGRLDIAACLVGRAPHAGDPPAGLRWLAEPEARHADLRGGAFTHAWETGTWPEGPPFGLAAGAARLACSVPALVALQADAYHALAREVGPLEPSPAVIGDLVRTGFGTADPPRRANASKPIAVTLALVDPETGARLKTTSWNSDDYLFGLSLATNRTHAVVSARNAEGLAVWDLARWEIAAQVTTTDRASSVAYAGDRLFVEAGSRVYSDGVLVGGLRHGELAAAGHHVAWIDADGLCLFDPATRTKRSVKGAIAPIAFSADGSRVATGFAGHAFTVIWPVLPSAAR